MTGHVVPFQESLHFNGSFWKHHQLMRIGVYLPFSRSSSEKTVCYLATIARGGSVRAVQADHNEDISALRVAMEAPVSVL